MTLDLDELERIGKAATAGPWEVVDGVSEDRWGIVTECWPVSPAIAVAVFNKPDAEFASAARNNWQAMIDELREHRQFREAMPGPVRAIRDYDDPCQCQQCKRGRDDADLRTVMWVCPMCGNKRCPHCEFHEFRCTGSNESGQVGQFR